VDALAQPCDTRGPARRRALAVFVGTFLIFSASSGGRLSNVDARCRYLSAAGLVERRDPALTPGPGREGLARVSAPGRDGKRYPVYGPGQTFLMVPFYIAGRGVAAVAGSGSALAERAGGFLVSTVMLPLAAAALCLVFYLVQKDLGVSEVAAVGAAAVLGFGTMVWQYAKFPAEETQVGLLLLVGLRHGLLWARGSGRRRDVVVFAAALGGALVFRMSAAPAAAVVGVAALAVAAEAWPPAGGADGGRRGRAWGLVASGAAAAVAAAALLAGWNLWRFGSWTETGYSASGLWREHGAAAFDAPFAEGFFGLLASPGKSVLLYNPVLLLTGLGWRRWRGRLGRAWWVVPGGVAATLLLYSKYHFWHGDWSWGPRFLVSTLPLACLPLGTVVEGLLSERGWRLKAAAAVIGVSVAVQAGSVVAHYGVEFHQRRHEGAQEQRWSVADSALVRRAANLALRAGGRKVQKGVLIKLNFWPNNTDVTSRRALWAPALVIWLASLGAGVFLLARALGPWNWWRPQGPPEGS